MKRIDYYFPAGPNEKNLNKLVKEPLFHQIIAYFRLQNGEAILLRRLKEAIITDENIEYILEKMIKYGLIERAERRYRLLIPIYTNKNVPIPLPLIERDKTSALISFGKNLSQEELATFLGELLWESCFPKEQNYFFGVERGEKDNDYFFKKIEIGNSEIAFVSIQKENLLVKNLATYFSILQTNQIPAIFKPLHQLIGDVDINYYVSQTKRVIKNAEKNRKATKKRNVFQESLIFSGAVSINESEELELNTSLIRANNYPNLAPGIKIVSAVLDEVNQQLAPSLNQQALASNYLYQEIVTLLSPKESSISYIKQID